MCGRFYIESEDDTEELLKIIEEVNRRHQERVRNGEVCPTDTAAVIAEDMARPMQWGFPKYTGKGVIINARSETATTKPMFSKFAREYRCLVPSSYYIEWQRNGKTRIKHHIGLEKRPIYMAGLFRYVGDNPVFCILTREAAPVIEHIHDRMPVLLPVESHRPWLDGEKFEDVMQTAILDVVYQKEEPIRPDVEQMSMFT